jgi:hypothetical protein
MTRAEVIAQVAKEMGWRFDGCTSCRGECGVHPTGEGWAIYAIGDVYLTPRDCRAALAFVDECEKRCKEAGV